MELAGSPMLGARFCHAWRIGKKNGGLVWQSTQLFYYLRESAFICLIIWNQRFGHLAALGCGSVFLFMSA